MNPNVSRGQLLFEQGRYELAERELRQALAANPQDAIAQALLAMCLPENKKFDEGVGMGRNAVGLAPDNSFCHYALGVALFKRDDHVSNKEILISTRKEFKEAEACVQEAIRLEPYEAHYFALLSSIRLAQGNWNGALEAATQGLEIDAENVTCINCRATALVKLGRQEEASQSLESALSQDPENSHTHSNRGWALLHAGKPYEALESYREALRLDPSNEYARAGMVEALKARNFFYRWMLAYFLWMSRLSSGAQWGVVIGGYVLIRILGSARRSNPELAPYVAPIQIVYALFVILTWTAPHLFNLLLRLDKFGRYVLSEDQIKGANCVGACVAGGLGLMGMGIALKVGLLLVAGLGCLGLMIPVGGTFNREGRARIVLGIYTLALIAVGAGAFVMAFMGMQQAGAIGGAFVIGLIGFPWVANVMATR